MWLGVGDAASQQMLVVKYEEASAVAFDANTLPAQTGRMMPAPGPNPGP